MSFGKKKLPDVYVSPPEFMSFDEFHQNIVTDAAKDFALEHCSGSRWTQLRFTVGDSEVSRSYAAANGIVKRVFDRYPGAWLFAEKKDGRAVVRTYTNDALQVEMIVIIRNFTISENKW